MGGGVADEDRLEQGLWEVDGLAWACPLVVALNLVSFVDE